MTRWRGSSKPRYNRRVAFHALNDLDDDTCEEIESAVREYRQHEQAKDLLARDACAHLVVELLGNHLGVE